MEYIQIELCSFIVIKLTPVQVQSINQPIPPNRSLTLPYHTRSIVHQQKI